MLKGNRTMKRCVPCWLAAVLLAAAGTAHGRGYSLKTAHYIVRTDVSAAFARELALMMEAIYKGYSDRLRTLGRDRKERHEVLVFQRRADYVGFVGFQYADSGGIYMPEENVLATYCQEQPYERMIETLKHEGFHQFLHSYLRHEVPVWVNEGLAQVFESAIRTDTGFVIGDAPAWRVRHMRQAIESGDAYGIGELLTLTHQAWGMNMASPKWSWMQYNQSWSVIHFLAYAKDAKYRKYLMAYLRAFDQTDDAVAVFRKVFATDEKAFTEAWKKYVMEEMAPSNRAVDGEHLRILGQMLGTLAEEGKTPQTMAQLHEMFQRGEVSMPLRGGLFASQGSETPEDVFISPEDPRVKDQDNDAEAPGEGQGQEDGDAGQPDPHAPPVPQAPAPREPVISYVLEPPTARDDPQWPTIRCTHHEGYDLIARHRRIGKAKGAPVILEVLQTRKKPAAKPEGDGR